MNTFQVLINSSRLPEALALVHVACAVYDSCFPLLHKIVFLKALYLWMPLQLELLEMCQLSEGCFLCSDLLSERAVQSGQRL